MTSLYIIGASAVAGAVGGGLSGWLVRMRHPGTRGALEMHEPIDDDDKPEIDQMAARWASSNGVPEASDLVARKLRLTMRLADRRNGVRP